jgi:uncharacterized membrane protein
MPPTTDEDVPFGRRAALTVAPFAAGLMVTLTVYLLLRNSLPDRLPIHFGASGADGYSSPGKALASYLVIYVIEAVLFLVKVMSDGGPRGAARSALTAAWAVAVATTYLVCTLLFAYRHTSDGRDVSLPIYQYIVTVACGAVVAVAGWLLGRRTS